MLAEPPREDSGWKVSGGTVQFLIRPLGVSTLHQMTPFRVLSRACVSWSTALDGDWCGPGTPSRHWPPRVPSVLPSIHKGQVTGHGEVQPLKMSKFSVMLRCVRERVEESLLVEYILGTGGQLVFFHCQNIILQFRC